MENHSPVTVTHHTLTDTILGPLFADQALVVPPGGTTSFTTTVVVTTTTRHLATWTASAGFGGPEATARAAAEVQIGYPLFLPAVRRDPG